MGGAQPSGASAGDLGDHETRISTSTTTIQASYVGKDGKRHLAPVTFDTKGDAGAWLDMMHAELLEHRWKPSPPPVPKPLTFKEYGRTWLAERELKPRTRSEYTRMLAILEDYFADAQLRAVTSADVKAWYATLDASKKTARAHLFSLLRTIFATAAADELVDANPCRLRGATTTKRIKTIRPATIGELTPSPKRFPSVIKPWSCWQPGAPSGSVS